MASLNTASRKAQFPPQGGLPPRTFEPSNTLRTHEGGSAATISPEQALRRAVCSCLLWENTFYESGQEIGERIADLATQVSPTVLATLAYDARSHFNLRHVPLLLCAVLARTGKGSRLVSDTIAETIQRPDELSEFLAVIARLNGVEPKDVRSKVSAQAKKGLARAFAKFNAYQMAKYFSSAGEKSQPVRGRDVMFLAHPKPATDEHADVWKRLANKESIEEGGADTWETALSVGKDKKETFTRLLSEHKLGYLALLRNLRNMTEAGVEPDLIQEAILARRGARRVLPFRYIAAARACPSMAVPLDTALGAAIAEMPPLMGMTAVLVDVSGSMDSRLSGKSDLDRIDAAATLALIIPGDARVFTFSDTIVELRERPRGLAGIEIIKRSQRHGGTYLGAAIAHLNSLSSMDRIIVITDEQAHDHVGEPRPRHAYLINVATYQNGIGYGERWVHIDGFSEQVLRFITEHEAAV